MIKVLQSQSSNRVGTAIHLIVVSILIGTTGCVDAIRRGQSPDNSLIKMGDRNDKTKFVGQICGIKGIRPMPVEGIGLVVGLEGTGCEPKPSGQKEYLLRELRGSKLIENTKAALASPNTAMVLVRGFIPPTAKKGDPIDLQVITPAKSDTKSLRYGELLKTDLRPMAVMNRSVQTGNVAGRAKGALLIDSIFTSDHDQQSEQSARILGGGVVNIDRDLSLVIHSKDSTVKLSRSVAHAINERYSSYSDSLRKNAATPETDRIVKLAIPDEYKNNLGRFIQSLQAMAYGESDHEKAERLKDLELRIADAASSRRAAIELEAIGEDALPILKRAIVHPDFEIRFYVAESLAYMGRSEGIEHLKLAAETEPAFRWHALTALSSIANAESEQALKSLLHAESAETRYGAFRALSVSAPDDPNVRGKLLSDEFYFHDIASEGSALVHFSQTKRPEIVVFGNERVAEDFIFVQPGLTARAIDRNRVRVVKFDALDGEIRLTCSASIGELIKTLSRFGVDYSTLLEMFQEADGNDTLNARLIVNAAPRIGSKSMKDSVQSDSEISEKYISTKVPELFSDVSAGSLEELE